MKPIYKVFYREKGIRYSDRLLRLPNFNLTVLPRSSLFHYVSDDINSPEVDTSLPFLQGYSKKILLDYVTDYVKTEGAVRRPMFAMKELTRSFRREHRQTWIFEPEAYKLNQNPETLIVINYGYLDVVHKYIPTMMANYHRWLNRQNTIWANVNKIASSSERHQFIFYPIAKVLQGRTILEKYAKESPSIKMMQIFGSHGDGGYLQLDMWKWLNPATRKQSLLGQIDPRHYNKINLVFQGTSGNQALVNLGYLNSWIKGQPNTTEFGSIVQFEPLFIQKLFLKMSMSLNAIETNEENTEGLDEIETVASPSQIAPIPKTSTEPSSQDIEEGRVDDTELDKTSTISEDDLEEKETAGIESGLVQKTKILPKKGPLEKEPQFDPEITLASFTSSFMDEVEKDIEALDKLSLTQLKNKGTKLNAEDPLIEEELIDLDQVRAKVYQSKPPSDRLKDWISEDAEANLITASEYRKLEQSIESYKESKDPYGSDAPRIEAMVIKEEDVVLSPEKTKIELSDTVPDVTMGNSTLKAFDTQYLRNVYKKDILQAIDSVQNAGVVIKNHEIEVRHSALGSYEHHRLELKPVDGMPSTIQFTLPQVNEDGTFLAGGNLYLLRKQRVDNPIRKIAPQIVSLSTYYGKTFVQTSSKVVNNDLAWLYREINAASLQQGLLIHEVNPGNVFDHDFKGPYIYNALAQEYEQFKVGDYSLYFDHRVRDKRVNPELLKIIEKKGRVWCGWSKDKSPIVVDKDNIFYEVRRDGETRLGNIYEFLELDTAKCPINFAETRVFSKYIPVGVMLSYYLGFSALIALLGEQYRVVPAKKNKQLEKDEYAISFRDESYIFKTKNKANTLILAGFQDFEKVTKLYDRKDFEHKDVYLNLLLAKKMSAIYVRELDMMQHAFIDPISKEVLQDMGEPTTFIALVIRAVEMLMSYDHPASQDRAAMRDRGYERFAGTVYKETMQAIRQFRNKNLVGRSKIDMSPYQIWNAIMKDSALKIVEDTNPIQNLKESEVITFAGTGGRDKDTITKPARAYHKNDLGVLSESTVDSTAVGTIAYLSADPNIKNVRGLMRDQKSLSPTNILSTSALLSPASMNDNPKRVMFITTQHSHTIASPGYRQPYLRTGYEFVVGKRTSKLFSTAAEEDGVVESVNQKGIIVAYDSGLKIGIQLGRLYGKAEGTYYPHDVVTPYKEGERFKKGDILAYNTKFFEPDFIDPKQIILKVNNAINTAFMECSQTHEDSCSISAKISDKFRTEVTKVKSYIVRFNQNLLEVQKPGSTVEPKDVLMIIEDEITSSHTQFSEDALSTLKRLSNVAPRAGVMGTVEKIEVFYHGDKRDMSLSLKKLADKSDADMAQSAKASNRPVISGRVTDEYRVEGTPLELDHAEVRIYITVVAGTGVGDKAVFGHQMKSTVSEVQKYEMHTEEGEEIDATFGYRSVANRGVMSPSIIGTTITLLDKVGKMAVDIYEGKKS